MFVITYQRVKMSSLFGWGFYLLWPGARGRKVGENSLRGTNQAVVLEKSINNMEYITLANLK